MSRTNGSLVPLLFTSHEAETRLTREPPFRSPNSVPHPYLCIDRWGIYMLLQRTKIKLATLRVRVERAFAGKLEYPARPFVDRLARLIHSFKYVLLYSEGNRPPPSLISLEILLARISDLVRVVSRLIEEDISHSGPPPRRRI